MDGVVRLDNWINFEMDPVAASQILALRPALEDLVIRATENPEQVLDMSTSDHEVRSLHFQNKPPHYFISI